MLARHMCNALDGGAFDRGYREFIARLATKYADELRTRADRRPLSLQAVRSAGRDLLGSAGGSIPAH